MAHLLRLRQSSTTLVDLTDTTKYKTTTWSDSKLVLHVVGTSIDTLLDNFTTLERALEIARQNDAARRAGKNYTPVYLQHQFNGGTNLVQSEVLGGSVRAPRNFLELIGRYAVLNYEITLARRPYFEETSAQSVGSGSAGNDGTGLSLSAARGDMPAPLYVKCRSSLASQDRLIAGVKWRGTVANFVSTYEAESYAVRGSNVADVTVGATFSGSSVDGQRWTPSGATNEQRLLLWRNTTNPTDQQGEYAVWVRCRDNKANPKVRLRFRSGVYDGSNDTWGPYGDNPKYCLTANSTIELVFCGTIQIPAIDTGGTVPNGYSFELRGACDSSPSTFDVDCVYLIPNDGAGDNAGAGVATMTKVAGTGALPDLVLDANDRVPKGYLETTGGAVLSPAADVAGSPLFVPPNQAAKLFVLTMASATGAHDFTGTNTLTANATPRYRWGAGTIPAYLTNLTALWSLDESSGTRVDAISAYDLTPTNTPGGAAGKVSTSTAFVSASSQELTRATAANLHPAGSFTAWGWIYETSIAAHGFVGVWEGGGKLEWQAWNAGTYWSLAISNDGTAATIKDYDTYAPIAGEWHFGVFQYDAANSIIRIKMDNGRHQDFAYASGINSNNGQFRMGSVGGAAFHGGRLDEWGFAKRVLSLGEMSVIWNYGSGMAYPFSVDKHPQVVCDGDSIARGYGITTIAGSMPAQLEALSTSYHVVNIGTDGKRIADMVSDGATRVDVIKDTTLFRENVVICQAGTNDLYDTITNVYNNIVSYCQARQAAGWKVVVATILPRTEAGLRAGFETDRQTVNASIVSNWATFADALSDIGNDATIGQAASPNNTTYYSDKVHPTAAGNAIIAALHKTALDSL